MANPAKHDLEVQRNSTVPLDITFKAGGVVTDITGYTFAASVFSADGTQNFANFAVTYTNRSQGKVSFKLTPAQTATFTPNELVYDVKYKQPNNDEFYLLEGNIFVSDGHTTIS